MSKRYASPRAVELAMKAAAQSIFSHDPTVSIDELLRQERFKRFLSRVFFEEESEFLLKGGTGILARVPNARATLDIDLFRSGYSLDDSLAELRRLAAIDLEDQFRFVYKSSSPILVGGEQTYSDGIEVKFDVYIGVKRVDSIKVDMAQGAGVTAEIKKLDPVGGLNLPKLQSSAYRLYPVVDQIADKVCATIMKYSGRDSTREKDLVDLAIFAATQRVDSSELWIALDSERRRRNLHPLVSFVVPKSWGSRYSSMAKGTPAGIQHGTIEEAKALMELFLDPILDGVVQEATWDPALLSWVPCNE